MFGPEASTIHPMDGFSRVCFIKNVIKSPNIIIGDYTYYDDPENPEDFENKNVLYHYDFTGDKLFIGKFCAIATGAKFIMNGANHKINAFTTYPFGIFGKGWEAGIPKPEDLPYKGDTIIGNDVWIGYDSVIMPGIKVGDGAIIAVKSVITKDVPPYTVVGGNPAIQLKKRFSDDIIGILLEVKWWNWDIKRITENIEILCGNDIAKLKEIL
jgi:virginiamycin A acetyltransferase